MLESTEGGVPVAACEIHKECGSEWTSIMHMLMHVALFYYVSGYMVQVYIMEEIIHTI